MDDFAFRKGTHYGTLICDLRTHQPIKLLPARDTYTVKNWLMKQPTDLRKSVDGLAAIVQESFQLDPFSSHLFVFCNRKKDKLKILHWDHNGFWLFYRRLEEGVFDWPNEATSPLKISGRQFKWLLEGLPMNQKSSHMKVSAKVVI